MASGELIKKCNWAKYFSADRMVHWIITVTLTSTVVDIPLEKTIPNTMNMKAAGQYLKFLGER